MSRPVIIQGELATPDPTVWTCPRPGCSRRTEDPTGIVKAAYCAGDPRSRVAHPLTGMVQQAQPDQVVEVIPAGRDRSIVRSITLAELSPVPLELPPGVCPTCGPLVDVDNPFRREVRHRRGCPERG